MQNTLLVQMSIEDLKGLIIDATQKALWEVNNLEQEELLSPKQAAEFLGIAKSTLHSYEKKGLVTKYLIGELPRFKKSELLEAFQKVERGRA